MQNDKSQLEKYANAGDTANFNKYLEEQYNPHLKATNDAIRAWKKDADKTLPPGQKKLLDDSFNELSKKYNQKG